jgi:hypothetical protein
MLHFHEWPSLHSAMKAENPGGTKNGIRVWGRRGPGRKRAEQE